MSKADNLYLALVICKRAIDDCLDELNNGAAETTKEAFVEAKMEVMQDVLKAACSDDPCVFD